MRQVPPFFFLSQTNMLIVVCAAFSQPVAQAANKLTVSVVESDITPAWKETQEAHGSLMQTFLWKEGIA